MKRAAFWVLFAVTVVLYAAMAFWSLPQVTVTVAPDRILLPFDLRLSGYSFEDAGTFLTALGADGTAFYQHTQHLLDAVFPSLLSLTLFFAIASLLPQRIGGWRWLVAVVALLSASLDLMENLAVDRLLVAGADAITPAMVAEASQWTMLKFALLAISFGLVLVLLLAKAVAAIRRRMKGAQKP